MVKAGDVKYFTYANVWRLLYAQGFGWAAQLAFTHDALAQVLGIDTKTFESSSMQTLAYCGAALVTCVSLGGVAAAQMSEAGSRKMLEGYVPGLLALIGYMIYHRGVPTPQGLQMNLGIQLINLIVIAYTCFGAHKSAPKMKGTVDTRLQKSLRWMALQQVAWALAWNVDASATYQMMGGSIDSPAGPYFAACFSSCMVFCAGLTICASEFCDASDARKYAQYAIVGMLAWNVVFAVAVADMMMKVSLQQAQFQMMLWMLNVMILCWGLYPASNKTWMFRWFYVNMYNMVVMATLNPPLAWALGGSSTLDATATTMVAGMMTFMFAFNVAAAQFDDASQKKVLQYTMLGYGYMLGMHVLGRIELGMWFAQLIVELSTVFYLCYPQYFSFISGTSSMKRGSSPKSPKSRKRSSTPKMRRA